MAQNGARQYPIGGQGATAPTGPQLTVPQANDQYTALQILSMAQRTAEEHVATARREAEHIRSEARSGAQQIIAEAQAQAGALREEADRVLARARASADRMARESEDLVTRSEQEATALLHDARERAEGIVQEAQANGRDIKHRAEQVYEDVVGGLATKRESLQQQIEALEGFERDYRSRLTTFMQQQMRALWVDKPQGPGELEIREIVELVPLQTRDEEPAETPDVVAASEEAEETV